MIETLNEIVRMMNITRIKASFEEPILNLEKEVVSFLKEKKYNPQNVPHIELRMDRIEDIEEKLSKIQDNNAIIFEGVKKYNKIMHDFLDKYHFGFLKDFYITKGGYFKVCIPVLIMKSSMTSKPESDKINFENQMKRLEEAGITISRSGKREANIEATTENIEAVKKLLSLIGAECIDIKMIHEEGKFYLREINCYVTPESIDNLSFTSEKFEMPVTDILNDDEIQDIYTNLKNMASAYGNASLPNVKDVCCSLILSHFSNICKTLGIETETSKNYELQFVETREKNKKIEELKNQIGEKVNAERIKEISKTIGNRIEEYLVNELNFYCSELKVSQYLGTVKASIISNYYFYNNEMSEEDFQEKFDCCNHSSRDSYSLEPLATERNMKLIEDFIHLHFKEGEIVSFGIKHKVHEETKEEYKAITEFEFKFSDIL